MEVRTREHLCEGSVGVLVDRKRMGSDSLRIRFLDRSFHVFRTVRPLILIVITGTPIGDEEDQLSLARLFSQQPRAMTQGRTDAGIS
jgi:hypothetical protein